MGLFELEKYGERTAIEDGERLCSYRELHVLSEEIAHEIGKRTLCFILASNTIASVAAYLGCINNGIVPVMIDGQLHRELLDQMIKCYLPSFIWKPADDSGDDFDGYNKVFEKEGYSLLKADSECPYEMNDELALLITTSGSTGSPKLVKQSYKNLKANTESIIEYLEITDEERAVTSLPMNYVYGLSVINTHIYAGAVLILTRLNCYSPKFWVYFSDKKATSFAGVPFMYEMMDKLSIEQTVDLSSLKTMTQAGGKLLPELQAKYARFAHENGKKFVVMYGASEATARMGYLPSEMAEIKNGSMGIAIPGGRFEIIDADGNTVEKPHETGELVYYGDNVTLGYAECGEDLAAGDSNKGRLVTGDMAERDEDGYYYIVGRKKRFIKIVGKRINLDELERNMKRELQSVDIVCVGRDDRLNIYITDESLKKKSDEYVFSRIGVSRGLYKTVIIPEIPKNASGKVLYSSLPVQ